MQEVTKRVDRAVLVCLTVGAILGFMAGITFAQQRVQTFISATCKMPVAAQEKLNATP